MDPIADLFPHVAPYNYAENKPINCIDLWGLQAVQVSIGGRAVLPMVGAFGISFSGEMGLILDHNRDLVMYGTGSLGVGAGVLIGFGINGTYYHTVNSYEDIVGFGLDVGLTSQWLLGGLGLQGNVSFSDDGPKGAGTLSYGIPGLSLGTAAFADATFTGLIDDFGVVNINQVKAAAINLIYQKMGISKQQVRTILSLMKAKLDEEEEKKWAQNATLIPAVVVTAEDTKKKLQKRIEDLMWQSVRPNEYGNTGRYNKPGRNCDQYYSDAFLNWYYNDPNKNEDKK